MNGRRARSDKHGATDPSRARGKNRHRQVLAAVFVLAGLATVAVLLWTSSSHDGKHPAAAPVSSFSQAQADTLVRQLSDPSPAVVADALATSIRPAFQAAPAAVLPAGDTLTIDAGSFEVGGDTDHGAVQATATGPKEGSFLVLLVRENGAWRVLGTVRK